MFTNALRAAGLLAVALLVATVGVPAAGAHAAGSDLAANIAKRDFRQVDPDNLWGYVHAYDPAAASYTPVLEENESSANLLNTVERGSTGSYGVTFTDLATDGSPFGVVLVTAYGTAGEFCNASWWNFMSGANATASVACFDAAGNRADVKFDASIIRPISTSDDYAYLWADHSTWTGPYTPSTTHQFNSTGQLNEITRNSTGNYEVRLNGLGGIGGTVKVTAFSSFAQHCKAASWRSSDGDKLVDVLCFDLAGAPADVMFALAYANGLGILANDAENGSVRANDLSVALSTPYAPDPDDQSNSTGASNTVTRTAQGRYTVILPELGYGGSDLGVDHGIVHVTASNTSSKRCEVVGWHSTVELDNTSSLVADVACHTTAGAPANSRFALQFTY